MSSNTGDMVNKDKIKNLKIHVDEINKIANKENIFRKKIQLWTNDKGNEYAISLLLDSNPKPDNTASFIASTNPNEEYKHLIAETVNIQNLQHGWIYTLRELIGDYKENRYKKVIVEDLHSIKLIPFYKCTYCNKELYSEEEQKKHELEWHV